MPKDSRETTFLPWALGAVLVLLVIAPALDPTEQLYYRDTFRCMYHFKQFIAEQLRAGRSPFWDPWTEAGTSVLVQITPGLFHPLTLLYLVLPFELAFKLNHLLAIPLAWTGLYLLARRLAQPRSGPRPARAVMRLAGICLRSSPRTCTTRSAPQ